MGQTARPRNVRPDKGSGPSNALLSRMMASGPEIERALERLYRTRYRAFCRMAAAVTGDLDRGHEAVQEGFARAYAARGQFRGSGPIEAWVWRIILRTAGRPSASEGELPDDLAVSLPFPERNEELARALTSLAPRRRLILFLRYYADLSLRDIADTLGIAEGTVSASLTQARAELRAALDEHARRAT